MLPTISRRRDRLSNDTGDTEENQPFINSDSSNNNSNGNNSNNPLLNNNNDILNGNNNNSNNLNNNNNTNLNTNLNNPFAINNLQNIEMTPIHQIYVLSLCGMCCIGCICSFWFFISIAQIIALYTEWNKSCDVHLQNWLLMNLLLPVIFATIYLAFLMLIHLTPSTYISANTRRRYRYALQKTLSNRTEVFIYSLWIMKGYSLWYHSKTCSDTAPVLYYISIFTIWISTIRLLVQFIVQCCAALCTPVVIENLRNSGLIDANMGTQQSVEEIFRNLLLSPMFRFGRGTPDDVIQQLRTETFQTNDVNDIESANDNGDDDGGGGGDRSCAICLAEFENGDQLRYLQCQHSFHCECIDQWLRGHRTCPMCRIDVVSSR